MFEVILEPELPTFNQLKVLETEEGFLCLVDMIDDGAIFLSPEQAKQLRGVIDRKYPSQGNSEYLLKRLEALESRIGQGFDDFW